jgi:hypothetical protein
MPRKHNEDRRHKIPKQKFKIRNWPAYNKSLSRRGDLAVWISEDALIQWSAPQQKSRGGQRKYSDLAITMCLSLRIVYDQHLRQTQGMMRSIAKLMGLGIAVPDFSILSLRGNRLVLPSCRPTTRPSGLVHLVVDSTGLKIFGEGEWLETKHKIKGKRKRWCKLHLGLDLISGEIICSELTTDDVGDRTALPGLLGQINGPVARFIADGAYDGSPTPDLLETRLGVIVEVIIPPPKTAVQNPQSVLNPSARDRHIAEIVTRGRMASQKSTDYNQKTEARIGVRVLDRRTELGRPEFNRVA